MNDPSPAFDSLLGGYKTYLTAATGILFNILAVFHVWNLTADQLTAVNGGIVLLAAAFLRMGVKKAQDAATSIAAPAASVVTGQLGSAK
jgi:hypothetical protein